MRKEISNPPPWLILQQTKALLLAVLPPLPLPCNHLIPLLSQILRHHSKIAPENYTALILNLTCLSYRTELTEGLKGALHNLDRRQHCSFTLENAAYYF